MAGLGTPSQTWTGLFFRTSPSCIHRQAEREMRRFVLFTDQPLGSSCKLMPDGTYAQARTARVAANERSAEYGRGTAQVLIL